MNSYKTSHSTPWALIKFGSTGTKFAFIRSVDRNESGEIVSYRVVSFKKSVSKIIKSQELGELFATAKKITPGDVLKQWRNIPTAAGIKAARGRYLRELDR